MEGRVANQKPTFDQLLNKYTKVVQKDRPLKRDRDHYHAKIVQCPQGGNSAGAEVMLLHCICPRRCMPPCHGCRRRQMLQIRHGSMRGFGCSVSRCHILHIIKGKVPEYPCMTDWDHANLVQCNMLHRSDRFPPTGQTDLIRGRAKFLFQDSSIASRGRKRNKGLWLIQRSLKPMLFETVKSRYL